MPPDEPTGSVHQLALDLPTALRLLSRAQGADDVSRPNPAQLRRLLLLAIDVAAAVLVEARGRLAEYQLGRRADLDRAQTGLVATAQRCAEQPKMLREILDRVDAADADPP